MANGRLLSDGRQSLKEGKTSSLPQYYSNVQEPGSLTPISSRVDLHSHTTASDGGLSPTELVARAARLGVEVLAITDHDTTEGLAEAQEAALRHQITLVPGVEISTVCGREEIHLLGFFVDPECSELQSLLSRTREARKERAFRMLERLSNLGLPLEWQRVLDLSGGGSIGRPHVAATMLEAGYVRSFDEAFSLWIGRGCPAYVERYKLTPEDAIDLVRQSGGVAVLAHPYIFDRSQAMKKGLDLKHWLPRLREAGLCGIEAYYANYSRRTSRRLLSLAIRYGLLVTGGSDFHGGPLGVGLGGVAVPWAVWEGLERKHRLMTSKPEKQIELASGLTHGLALS